MTTPTQAYLAPILEAATLLGLRPFSGTVEQLAAILDKLSPQFPRDVLDPLEALRILAGNIMGSVEELEILDRIWPDWNGSVSYTLTATTITWRWSAKHTGRYATITVPFPTALPLNINVARYCDMDDQNNHSDECDPDGDNCHCEGFVEQTVAAQVTEWDDAVEAALADWLSRAVTETVNYAEFPKEGQS